MGMEHTTAERVGFSAKGRLRSKASATERGCASGTEPTIQHKKEDVETWFSGEGGIRTHDTLAGIPPFQGGQFNHSCTSPCVITMGNYWMADKYNVI